MMNRDKFYINGAWVAPSVKDTLAVHNAGTGEVMGSVPAGGASDMNAAVEAARAAFDAWSQTPVATRIEYLNKISAGLKARYDELARLIAQEVGMPIKLAGRIQANLPIMTFANYAKLAGEFKFEEQVGNSIVVRDAVGVVGAIGNKRNAGIVYKQRRDHGHVRQMRTAQIRVVDDDHVARLPDDGAYDAAHCKRHAAEVHRDMGGLCTQLPARVEQCARIVETVLDIR